MRRCCGVQSIYLVTYIEGLRKKCSALPAAAFQNQFGIVGPFFLVSRHSFEMEFFLFHSINFFSYFSLLKLKSFFLFHPFCKLTMNFFWLVYREQSCI